MDYEAVIGLEIHVQIQTESKMFCACPNRFGAEPNTLVCPVCLGYPGVLPVINRAAVEKTIAAGLMCGCRISRYSKFDRKNYFYPDMPKNYQISQYDLPLCTGGAVRIGGKGLHGDPVPEKDVRLIRIHLEEDVAKSIHFDGRSGIDFNRAGVPLMEIVTEPDMRTQDEAWAFLAALRQVMQYAGISDCDMEKGQLRCDVNVSVRPAGSDQMGTKVEIKNLNSFRAVHRALEFEIDRQIEEIECGGTIKQETRRWNDDLGETTVMRTKESAHDYRYFPEPDLLPVEVDEAWIERIRAGLPESPAERRARFVREYQVTPYDAHVLTSERALADFFEAAARASKNAKAVANWVQTELLRGLGERGLPVTACPFPPEHLAELVGLIDEGAISGKIAKDVFAEMMSTGRAPKRIVEAKGLRQVSDAGEIERLAEQVIRENPAAVEQFRAGKEKALQFLMGRIMRLTRGQANPRLAMATLRRLLERGE